MTQPPEASSGLRRGARRGTAALMAVALAAAGLAFIAPAAQADTAPVDPTLPTTVSADPLPTVQIDGVVWKQQIVGNTVFVGGEFKNARPAGAAAGTNLTARSNFLAYTLSTGNLITSIAPTFNAQVKDLAVSPDGTKLYASGSFTEVNGVARYRVAQFDLPSMTLTNWKPSPNSQVASVVASNSAVYLGGSFSVVNGANRTRLAAVSSAPAATLLPLNMAIPDNRVQDMVLSSDGSQLVIGGDFTSVNGSNNPGYGLAKIDVANSAMLPLPINSRVRNAGAEAAILSLESDGTSFYGAGYHFGRNGTIEGSFSADWNTGSLNWLEDCHGDTYAVYPIGNVVYQASHKHYCGNSGGFPQTDPWSYQHSTAVTNDVRGTNTADIYGYPDHPGTPRPQFLDWYPKWGTGTYTGKSQAVWAVGGNSDYVVYGGEFPRVGTTAQQGLVRFARKEIAPNKIGPALKSAKFTLSATGIANGIVRLAWPGNPDPDNINITYKLYRDSTNSAPIHQYSNAARFWELTGGSFVDRGLTPGASVRYRVVASDPFGNDSMSDWVTVTVPAGAPLSAYADGVLTDSPNHYWRLGEGSGAVSFDWAGPADLTRGSGAAWDSAGAINGDPNGASNFSASANRPAAGTTVAEQSPNTFTAEAWFKTNTSLGGKIVGFGSSSSGNSSSYDRHIYMANNGTLQFGVYPGSTQVISSGKSYNDNVWHHVVASLSPAGMTMYVDGLKVGGRTDVTSGQPFNGYWRIGGDNLGSWPSDPASDYFSGRIDDVAIYPTALTKAQIIDHYVASGRVSPIPAAPADAYGKAVYDAEPEFYWRMGETSGTAMADSSASVNPGVLSGTATRNVAGPLAGTTSKAVTFGTGFLGLSPGVGYSSRTWVNPQVYSTEAWFKTNTTSGGKIIGFGSSQTGNSPSYDRHVYMQDDGKLVFGAYNGATQTITTAGSYRDNTWHHVVATQGPGGMRLYVDGALQGTNPNTVAENYTGYWRIGNDTTWGSSSRVFAGSISEVAVYSKVLDAAEVAAHYTTGSTGTVPNKAPVAAFDATTTKLKVAVDGSASSDEDGTVASYAWNFGDGTTKTGATETHTYAAAGTYTVTLTITDDKGATHSTTRDVAAVANQAPTAAVAASTTGLKVSVDADGSADTDGSVDSYAWDFGDGGAATGPVASHTYAAAGTYTVTLTVTDNEGATGTNTAEVTVAPVPNVGPTASFTATVFESSVGVDASASTDSDGSISAYRWDFGDGATDTGVNAGHTYASPGSYTITLEVEDNAGAKETVTRTVTVTAPDPALANDLFERASNSGWGNADKGGAWTATGGASRVTVAGGLGLHTLNSGATLESRLAAVQERNVDITTTVALDKLPASNYVWAYVGARQSSTQNGYFARLRINADGTVGVHLLRDNTPLVGANAVAGLTLTAGARLNVRFQTESTSETASTFRVKLWPVGTTEPTAWTYTRNDATAANQVAGAVGLKSYSPAAGNNPIVVSWDDYKVTTLE